MAAKQAEVGGRPANTSELLDYLRAVLKKTRVATVGSQYYMATQMLDAFEALDAMLSNGAPLPEAWAAAGAGCVGDPELYVLLDEHGLVMRTASRPSEVDSLTAHLAGRCRWVRYVSTPTREALR